MIRTILYCPIILLQLILTVHEAFAQYDNTFTIRWHFVSDEKHVEPNRKLSIGNNGDSIQINTLRFYISNIQLEDGGKIVSRDWVNSHLIDWEVPASTSITIANKYHGEISNLMFLVGVDSSLQANGIGDGDLDPIHGMYWTWQSGYINFKLEADYNLAGQATQKISWHLGGFMAPYRSDQKVTLPVDTNDNTVDITIDIGRIIQQGLTLQAPTVMSPSSIAVQLSKVVSENIRVK